MSENVHLLRVRKTKWNFREAQREAKRLLSAAEERAREMQAALESPTELSGVRKTELLLQEILRIEVLYPALMRQQEKTILDLVCDISAEVIGEQIREAPASLRIRLERFLEQHLDERLLRIHVHPDDVLHAEAVLSFPALAWASPAKPKIIGDQAIARGNALLISGFGTFELNLDSHLEALLSFLRTDSPLKPETLSRVNL